MKRFAVPLSPAVADSSTSPPQARHRMRVRSSKLAIGAIVCVLVIFVASDAIAARKSSGGSDVRSEVTDRAAIQEMEHRDIEASEINDVETLASLWTEDGVLIQPGTNPLVGKPAIRAALDQQQRQMGPVQTVAYDEKWNEVRIAGDYAWEWGQISATIRLPNGKEISQSINALRILARQADGSWKVARAIFTPQPKKA